VEASLKSLKGRVERKQDFYEKMELKIGSSGKKTKKAIKGNSQKYQKRSRKKGKKEALMLEGKSDGGV